MPKTLLKLFAWKAKAWDPAHGKVNVEAVKP